MKQPSATRNPKLGAIFADPSYDDRQLGQVIRLYLATGVEYTTAGYDEGFSEGSALGYSDGTSEGYELGFAEGEDAATTKRVYVGVWTDDVEVSDLGTSIRLVGVATSRERALALANAYRDKRAHGSVFSFSFRLDHNE